MNAGVANTVAPKAAASLHPTAAHIFARGIAVDFVVEGRRQRVLNDINLMVPKGSFVSLIGPSGCGKSTLLKVMAGLITPSEGEMRVSGISPQDAVKAKLIGLVFQEATLLPWKNAIENAAFLLMTADETVKRGEAMDRAAAMLRLVGLEGCRKEAPVTAVWRHAPAGSDRSRARARSRSAAHGRTLRRARCHHPRGDE